MKKNIIIILSGGTLRPENEPTLWSKPRYLKAIELYNQNPKNTTIMSTCYASYREGKIDITEAQIGKNYLLKHINPKINPTKDIILEEKSKCTLSNALYAAKMMNSQISNLENHNIIIITSEFHMPKSKYIFENIIYPKSIYPKINLEFIETDNNIMDQTTLKAREISEKEVINYYKTHLEQTYEVKFGDLDSIENYLLKYSKSYNSITKEKYQEELTKIIEIKTNGIKNPLY